MTENMGKWPSGHGQLTKIRLSHGCGGKTITAAAQFDMIAMNLKVTWEMSVNQADQIGNDVSGGFQPR